jgi:HK97 family phage major capsid protein
MSLKSLSLSSIISEMRALAEVENISPADNRRLDQLTAEYEARMVRRAEAQSRVVERASGVDEDAHPSPTVIRRRTRAEVFATEARNAREAADLAARAIDVVESEGGREVKPEVRSLIERHPGFAEQFRATADPAYASAFARLVLAGDAGRAMLSMSDEERSAMQRVSVAEMRAVAVSPDTAGGYAVPQLLDPAIVVNNDGTIGRVRDLARVVTGISDKFTGINSAGITAAWSAEGSEVADGSPELQSNDITAHRATAFVPFSIEVEADWQGMVEQMRVLLADSKDRLENSAFISGDGSGKPYGIVNRLDASTTTEVIVTTSGQIGSVDIYKVLAELPPRYRSNASWVASLSVLNEIRAIGDDKLGNYVTDLTGGYGFALLGRPVFENSEMDAMVTTTAAANFAVVGDLSGYTIFDRLGSARVELVSHLFGSNQRPTGQRGLLYFWRVGADLTAGAASTEPGMRLLINKTS